MPAPKNIDPGESPLHFFGSELRHHRTRVGLTQEQLGGRINYSADLVSKVETGEDRPSAEFARGCDTELDTGGALSRLLVMVRWGTFPPWLRPWVEAEREAHTLRNWEPNVIPGLLQTADYARGLVREQPGVTEEQLDELVAARLERQKILARDEPPLLWVLLGEGVLHYEIGSPEVMRGQLQALVDASKRANVTIQVVPSSAGAHPGLDGAFWIASYDGSPDVVYLESVGEGHVSDRTEDVRAVTRAYDAIRAKALPDRASVELIMKVMEQWT